MIQQNCNMQAGHLDKYGPDIQAAPQRKHDKQGQPKLDYKHLSRCMGASQRV